jgi:hypothetical protein
MDYFGRPDPIAQFAAWILKLHFVGNRRRQLPQDRDPVRVRQLRLGLVTSRLAVARGLLRGAPRRLGLLRDDDGRRVRVEPLGKPGCGNGAGRVYGVGHGTPPN